MTKTQIKTLARMEVGKWYTQHELETSRQNLVTLRKAGLIKRRLHEGIGLKYPEANQVFMLTARGDKERGEYIHRADIRERR